MSTLDDLEDDTFAEASRLVTELCQSIERTIGRKPTSAEFLELLSAALQETNSELFIDISPSGIAELVPRLKKNPKKIQPGTLIGIPSLDGGWFFVLFLTSNTFGDAFGVFKGKFRACRVKDGWTPEVIGVPVYSGLRALREGQWRVLGERPELLRLFPAEPEIYHSKAGYNMENPTIGKYGSAETPAGKLRSIEKVEAEAIGLLSGEYQQCLLPNEFVHYLQKRCS